MNNPFPRPSHPLYQGRPEILASVSYGLDRPATLAIVDITKEKAIAYRSIRQLLGNHYKLLTRYRLQQQQNEHRRHNRQRNGASNRLQESQLGEYLDCLIAQAIVSIAQTYQASSIVLPDLGNIREIVEAEVQARAEQRIIGYLEGQQQYAKQYRASVHRWSYRRLNQKIQNQAAQTGILIEQVKQPLQGTPQEKARNLAIAAYKARELQRFIL
jgi:IS605 OrfB family transposase